MPTYDYYAWYTYDLMNGGRFAATVRTDEVRYYRGHQHGVQPSGATIAALRVALYNAVLQRATALGIAYAGNPAVLAGANYRSRSERA